MAVRRGLTVITGGYEATHSVLHGDPATRYFLLTDRRVEAAPEGWDAVIVCSLPEDEPIAASRRAKMHLLQLIPDAGHYDAIVFLDGNLQLVGPLEQLINDFIR